MEEGGGAAPSHAEAICAAYARNAERFDDTRDRSLFERPWLERFCARLPQFGRVLDVGCGAGEPIARYLIENDYALTGVDFAQPMLDLAAARLPSGRWLRRDMRDLDLGACFDGVVAWHSVFHLTPAEQRASVPRLARHVAPGGALMMTVGPVAGETTGVVGDAEIYHASLSEEAYRDLLAGQGLEVVAFVRNDPTCARATVLLAHKPHSAEGPAA